MNTSHPTPEFARSSGQPDKSNGFHLGYRRNLDGLRGVAILMVFLSHLWLLNETWAFMGVQIFFVLSGFLITSLLVEEWSKAGSISLRAFYWRRALRLLPALFVMLSVFILYGALFRSRTNFIQDLKEAGAAAFYYSNWIQASGKLLMEDLGHTWSLSIEEQYYFIWPAFLLLLLRRCQRETVLNLAVLGVFLAWLTRFLVITGTAATSQRVMRGSDTRADALLLGSALGLLLSTRPFLGHRWFHVALKTATSVSVAGLVYMGCFCSMFEVNQMRYGWSLMCLFTGMIILELMLTPGAFSRWTLENRLLVYLGKISYGLYLWHFPIIMIYYHDFGMPDWRQKLLLVLFSFAATLASFYWIERPFLRLKRRFEEVSQRSA